MERDITGTIEVAMIYGKLLLTVLLFTAQHGIDKPLTDSVVLKMVFTLCTHTYKQRPWDVLVMTHFDPKIVGSVLLNVAQSCQCYFWVCWVVPSPSHFRKEVWCSWLCIFLLLYNRHQCHRLRLGCFVIAPAYMAYGFSQLSHSLFTTVGLLLFTKTLDHMCHW